MIEYLIGPSLVYIPQPGRLILRLVAGLMYGVLYLFAWSGPFSSTAVEAMWRMSAITVAASGFILPMLFIFNLDSQMFHDRFFLHYAFNTFRITSLLLIIVSLPLYFFARTFLVVECFLQLARLPDTTYQETS